MNYILCSVTELWEKYVAGILFFGQLRLRRSVQGSAGYGAEHHHGNAYVLSIMLSGGIRTGMLCSNKKRFNCGIAISLK